MCSPSRRAPTAAPAACAQARRRGASALSPLEGARRALPPTPPASRLCARSSTCRLLALVFVVTTPPGPGVLRVLVAAQRRHVEVPQGPHELLDAACVRGVRVVDHSVLQDEGA